MTSRRVKKKAEEKLTDSNIKHVIGLLEGETPITKKEACAILNISYNTTRLNNIIEEFKTDQEYRARKKAEKRGKPASNAEKAMIAEAYLEGDSVADIAKRVFRSSAFIKSLIDTLGVPQRVTGEDKHKPSLLPESCVAENFDVGEIAWSAVHHRPCEIRGLLEEKYNKMYGVPCYKVWVREPDGEPSKFFGVVTGGGFNAFLPAYELGKLAHLEEIGVNTRKL